MVNEDLFKEETIKEINESGILSLRETIDENESLYDEWFSDNKISLMSDYLENHLTTEQQEDYEKYLAEEFSRWREDNKNNDN